MATREFKRGGDVVFVDAADAWLLENFPWACSDGYVRVWRGRWMEALHRIVAGAGPGERVDHINRNTLDNRTVNLRIATPSQNGANRIADRRRVGTTSRHKGVSWNAPRRKWQAYIHVNGKTRYLGRYATEDEAAVAYNTAAIETWGEFARLNDLGEQEIGDAE